MRIIGSVNLLRSRHLAALFACLVYPSCGFGQDTGGLNKDPVFSAWKGIPGVQACGRCHFTSGNDFANYPTDFCQLTELRFWLAEDKHAIARRRIEPLSKDDIVNEGRRLLTDLLKNGITVDSLPEDWLGPSNLLSHTICKELGIDVAKEEGYQQFRDQCLNCHGGYSGEQDAPFFAKGGSQQPGISCNYCHQIDQKNAWVDVHGGANSNQWRLLSPAAKAEQGMRDLVSVTQRAALCSDCHIGNLQQVRFISHAMYAAGHPPLPSFELQTYVDAMPKHWRSTSELVESLTNYADRGKYFAVNYPGLVESEQPALSGIFWETRQLMIGALQSRRHALELLKGSVDTKQWGDFALYDCSACHHELRLPSAWQEFRATPPGRPQPAQWPEPLIRAALIITERKDEIERLNQELTSAFGQKPFGEPTEVKQACKSIIQVLDRAIKDLETAKFDTAQVRRVFLEVIKTPRDRLLDYHSARQIVWGLERISDEFAAHQQRLPESTLNAIAGLKDSASAKEINTKLPSGRKQFIYREYLQEELLRQSRYDPFIFDQRLRAMIPGPAKK